MAALKIKIKVSFRESYGLLGDGTRSREHTCCDTGSKIGKFVSKTFPIRVIWGLLRPQEALLLFRDLNVKVLLFMAPNINIVEVLTIRTVFSP